jgi:hypothetical protein
MNAPETFFLPDVQSLPIPVGWRSSNVGVKGLRYPMQFETSARRGDEYDCQSDDDGGFAARGQGYAHVALRRIARRARRADPGSAFRMLQKCCCALMRRAAGSK